MRNLTCKKTQFSLIKAYKDKIIPRMEEVARIESENGKYEVVFSNRKIQHDVIIQKNTMHSKIKSSPIANG